MFCMPFSVKSPLFPKNPHFLFIFFFKKKLPTKLQSTIWKTLCYTVFVFVCASELSLISGQQGSIRCLSYEPLLSFSKAFWGHRMALKLSGLPLIRLNLSEGLWSLGLCVFLRAHVHATWFGEYVPCVFILCNTYICIHMCVCVCLCICIFYI